MPDHVVPQTQSFAQSTNNVAKPANTSSNVTKDAIATIAVVPSSAATVNTFNGIDPRRPHVDHHRSAGGKLQNVMEHEEAVYHNGTGGSSSSGSDEDSRIRSQYSYAPSQSFDDGDSSIPYTTTPLTTPYTPSTGLSSGFSSWNSYTMNPSRPRGGSSGGGSNGGERSMTMPSQPPVQQDSRLTRPGAPSRTPSSTYAPARRPPHLLNLGPKRMHSSSTIRQNRRDPNAQYRAQEKAYVQRVRQQPPEWMEDPRTPSVGGYSTEDDTEDESPLNEHTFDDPYDPEAMMFLGNEDNIQPSEEELLLPENRERLEWHAMLASVLKGDVVKQEKQRLIGTTEQKTQAELGAEIWYGARAKYYGRPLAMQKKMIEEARAQLGPVIEGVITFEIKGETVVGKTPLEQVKDVVDAIEKIEWLYPNRAELEANQPRVTSDAFKASCSAVISWHNINQTINTELGTLQAWVGNPELDFTKQRQRSGAGGELTDESSFIDRILKEDGLKSLQGEKSMFRGIGEVITKAKSALIENADAFAARHLPPYIEELLILVNFPSRLCQEIIRMRLSYARKMKESAQQQTMIVDQMIDQFQILMKLACAIKQEYLAISNPEPGWDLPPCIDESFDSVIVEALKFYFKMLNWKLGANKNTFREAEILEQEWDLSNEIGRQLEGGDIEVAEQFSSLTAKSLLRLTTSFERELRNKPGESSGEMEKRYKAILDSVRVRQRKLFRFSRMLRQRFENATEYNLSMDAEQLHHFSESLALSHHFLVSPGLNGPKGVYFVASKSLWNRPKEIQSILGTSFHAEDEPEDPSNPYILVIRPEDPMAWDGPRMELDLRDLPTDARIGRLRLVADGSTLRLQSARIEFANSIDRELDVVIEQRANLSRVNQELGRIKKTTFKLSNTIMESVEVIRSQNNGIASPELIQSCFAFATEFAKRSLTYMDPNRRMMNNLKLTRLGLDWISFICDDCDAADRRTFKWAVIALEFAMVMTRGRNVLDISEEEYSRIRSKVAGCMSVLISHFDIMGARSTLAAQQEKSRLDAMSGTNKRLGFSKMGDDAECCKQVCEQRMSQLELVDSARSDGETKVNLGRVLEGSNEAERSLALLSSSATTIRWQQGSYIGGGTFGSVYSAINLDTGIMMAVKEIRLQDPQLVPTIVKQIHDEMGVLRALDHPNIVRYEGIEVHRDKVYIFMEYCQGGSIANLLEHGRIENEPVVQVYALQMLEGLAYLHQARIVHRDIKPENVLLDANGLIKFVDFGAAKIIARQGQTIVTPDPGPRSRGDDGNNNRGGPRGTGMTGTPMYMSPEVIRGEAPADIRNSAAADIWSLGCVILEMATGRRPWSALDNQFAIMYAIVNSVTPQMPRPDELSEPGVDFLRKCFDRDPTRRSTAAELLQHPWIVEIRTLVMGDTEAQTPRSESGGSGGGQWPSRSNSGF